MAGLYPSWGKFYCVCGSIPSNIFQTATILAFCLNRCCYHAGRDLPNRPAWQARHRCRNGSCNRWNHTSFHAKCHALIIDVCSPVSNSASALGLGLLFFYGHSGINIFCNVAQRNFTAIDRLSPKNPRRLFRDLVPHAWPASKAAFIFILYLVVHFFLFYKLIDLVMFYRAE